LQNDNVEAARTSGVGDLVFRVERTMNAKIARHRTLAAFLLVAFSGLYCLKAQSPTPEEKPFPVSLIRLIANPEKFDGHRVRVIGVLGYGGGLDQAVCLYFSDTDARNGVMSNCIYVDRSEDRGDKQLEKYLGKYVILNATLRYIGRDRFEFLSFHHITDMRLWSSPAQK
jgi:hypothetical protein